VLNGEAFLAAAKKSSDPNLKASGESLWSAGNVNLNVDAKGGYPVAYRNSFSGAYGPLKVEGDFDVQTNSLLTNPINLCIIQVPSRT
jgi:hypothetical protein